MKNRGALPTTVTLRVCVGRGQEFGGGERIEVEHLSPGELSVANLVQAKDGSVKLAAGLDLLLAGLGVLPGAGHLERRPL